jgi:hypothetical protein
VAVVIATVVCAGLLLYIVASVRSSVRSFGQKLPEPLPTIQVSDAALSTAHAKVAQMQQALGDRSAVASVKFSEEELAALLEEAGLSQYLRVQLNGAELRFTFSLPLNVFNSPILGAILSDELRAMYLNGQGVATLGMEQGKPGLKIHALQFNGADFPEDGRMYAEEYLVGMVMTEGAALWAGGSSAGGGAVQGTPRSSDLKDAAGDLTAEQVAEFKAVLARRLRRLEVHEGVLRVELGALDGA